MAKTRRETKAPPTPEKALQNLDTLALFISNDIRNAMMASLVMRAADAFAGQYGLAGVMDKFRTLPANTWHYAALRAMEERAIVNVSEWLKDDHSIFRVSVKIRRKRYLFLHRNALSHQATIKWDSREMQGFADSGRHDDDDRPALLWDLQRSINEGLRAKGKRTYLDEIPVTHEMALMLQSILDCSRRPESAVHRIPELLEYLKTQVGGYTARLEKMPDGRVPGRSPRRRRYARRGSAADARGGKSPQRRSPDRVARLTRARRWRR